MDRRTACRETRSKGTTDRGFAEKPDDYYPNNWRLAPLPAQLWPTGAGTPLSIAVMVGAVPADDSRLRVEVEGLAQGQIAAAVNDTDLLGLDSAEGDWLEAALPPTALVIGANRVDLSLRSAMPDRRPPTVKSVEIHTSGAP